METYTERDLHKSINRAFSIKMVSEKVLSPTRAAKIAEEPLEVFMKHLGDAEIPTVNYSPEDLDKELEIIKEDSHLK